ncbi:hypothetical protein H2204_013188 [Knufia peltigerae]|uniref:F-box domain-containing protein n=1 Tax=Knufia peltigerae TaxID=1002370 RepID=A0AA38XRB9_9EURO|nr:hypothetical protein H2204_013188 [Knufia peltigerae]
MENELTKTWATGEKQDTGTAEQTEHYDHNHHHPPLLLNLPNETILNVASFLDRGSQILLSLSCRQLRCLLLNHCYLDLTPSGSGGGVDKTTKVRFLRLLELDQPKYLTCRSCGLLYLWRVREFSGYGCPRENHHASSDVRLSYGQWIRRGGKKRYLYVRREVVDLILRAHMRGPDHGLPLSFCNVSGLDDTGVFHTNEARVVDGQFLLASRTEVEVGSGREAAMMIDRITLSNMCLHVRATVGTLDDISKTLKQALGSMALGSEMSEVFKCSFCETDHRMRMKKGRGNLTTMVLEVWRNYGQLDENRLSTEQIFHRDPVMRIDTVTISRRDVRAAFEAQTSDVL